VFLRLVREPDRSPPRGAFAVTNYRGRAQNLARVLQPTTPIRIRPWGRLAWLVIITLGAALIALAACTAVIIPFRLTRISYPLGMPRAGWEWCWDRMGDELATQDVRARTVGFTKDEYECFKINLMRQCAGEIENAGAWDKLFAPSEVHYSPRRVDDEFQAMSDRCKDEGSNTERVIRNAMQVGARLWDNACPPVEGQ